MNKDEIRKLLAQKDQSDFDDINNQKILGASTHITLIGRMIENMALDHNESVASLISRVRQVCDFFIETRGEASQAVSNAIAVMTQGLDDLKQETDLSSVAKSIIETKDRYKAFSEEATQACVDYAYELLKDKANIFVYDYSSTVDKVLASLKDSGTRHHIYIAESRIIDGGKPFLDTCLKSKHQVTYLPDAAMMHFLKKCDVALMGAETFYPDGTAFNTTGSDIVGLVCKTFNIPLYFITPLIKVDARPLSGKAKNIVYNDTKTKLTKSLDKDMEIHDIRCVVPELLGVPSDQITAFITEKGIIPSTAMFDVSLQYLESIKGESL